MKKETVEKIIADYEADKENKGFLTIIMNNGEKFRQTPFAKGRLSKFELLDDETLVIEFSKHSYYIQVSNIDKIHFRSTFLR